MCPPLQDLSGTPDAAEGAAQPDSDLRVYPGQTVEGSVVIPAEGIAFICTVAGHAASGMTGTVTVDGPAPSAAASAAPDDHGGPAPETEIVADPNAPPCTNCQP